MKKYQINLFEAHLKTINTLLQEHSVDPRLQDFIMTQVRLQDLSRESSQLQLAYDKHLSAYENTIGKDQIQRMHHA